MGEVACRATLDAAARALLAQHVGNLLASSAHAKFFAARLTEVQRDALFADPCTFTVEPNYVVWVRVQGRGKGNPHPHPDNAYAAARIPSYSIIQSKT
jgi:hypothetical protein